MSILKVENQINPSAPTYLSDCPEIQKNCSAEPVFSSRSEEIKAKLLSVLVDDLNVLYPDKSPVFFNNIQSSNQESDSTIFYQIEKKQDQNPNQQTISFDHKEDPHNPGQQICRTLTATFKSNQITSLGVTWSWEPNLKA